MRIVRLVMLGICVALLAFARPWLRPAVNPAHAAADGKAAIAAPHEGQSVSPEEWVEISKWMEQYRPAQFRVLNALPEGQKNKAKQLVAEKYRSIKRLNNPRMREAALAEARAQDEVFAAEISYRDAKRTGIAAQINAAKSQMQTAAEHLFEAKISGKSARIDFLQGEIEGIQKDIERMQKKRQEFVGRWTNRLLNGRPIQDASPAPAESPAEKPSDDPAK